MKVLSTNQNKTNFKALYKPNDYNFSPAQQRVIKDIENKLGDRILEQDFRITPYGNDSVELHEVEGVTYDRYNGCIMFNKDLLCAVCNEKTPFDIDKYDKIQEDNYKAKVKAAINTGLSILAASVASVLIIMAALGIRNKIHNSKISSEFVNNVVSFKNNISKDTLDLTKVIG